MIGDGNMLPDRLREHFIVPITVLISMISLHVMSTVDFLSNDHDNIIQACTSLSCTIDFTIWIATYLHFWINRKQFYSLFDDVADTVNGSA